MNRITITTNGKTVTVEGQRNISVINGNIIVDGKRIDVGEIGAGHEVTITGNCGSIKCDGNVTVEGSVYGNIDCGGSCKCGDVSGDIDAGGSVQGSSYGGNIDAGGSVRITRK